MIPAVRDAGHRCIAPDLPGFGPSDKPVDLDWYSYDRNGAVMAGLLALIELRGDTAVVHDWGGPIRLSSRSSIRTGLTAWSSSTPGFTGRQTMSDAWRAFRDFVERSEDLALSMLVTAGAFLRSEVQSAHGEPGRLVGTRLMLPEIADYAGPLSLIAGGLALAVLASALTERVPVPAPAVFLAGAAIASDVFPGLEVGILTVERVAVIALIVILLNGGRDIGAHRFQRSLKDIASLGLLGTLATAAALAVAARVLLGLDWAVAGVLGAALAPTDPAVMFSVLGRREVGGRSGTVLEGEAGFNDPAGIALLLGMVEVATHPGTSLFVVVESFVLAMGIGLAFGVLGGKALIALLARIQLGASGLYPVVVLVLAGVLYGVTTLADGSGFLAVFVTGLLLGDARLPYGLEIDRFTAGLASLAEVAVFLALGLTIDVGSIPAADWLAAAAILLWMALVVRPAIVALTLARSALTRNEKAFIAWSGLKGAVPILLAAFAVLGNVAESQRIYDVVFVVVLGSVVFQGGLVPTIATRLQIPMQLQPALPWELSVKLAHPPDDRVELTVTPGSPADGTRLSALPLDDGAWVTLILRDDRAMPPRPDFALRGNDTVFLLGVQDEATLADQFS